MYDQLIIIGGMNKRWSEEVKYDSQTVILPRIYHKVCGLTGGVRSLTSTNNQLKVPNLLGHWTINHNTLSPRCLPQNTTLLGKMDIRPTNIPCLPSLRNHKLISDPIILPSREREELIRLQCIINTEVYYRQYD